MANDVCYYGTKQPIRVGDRIVVKGLIWGTRIATVVYVPGQSELDPDIGDHQWAYKTDTGGYFVAGYFPAEMPMLGKRVQLLSRAGEDLAEIVRSFKMPPETEPDLTPRQGCWEMFAFLGVVTFGMTVICLLIAVIRFLLGFR